MTDLEEARFDPETSQADRARARIELTRAYAVADERRRHRAALENIETAYRRDLRALERTT